MPPPLDTLSSRREGALAVIWDLGRVWREHVQTARVRVEVAAGVLVFFGAVLTARFGTAPLRITSLVEVAIAVTVCVWLHMHDGTAWTDPSRVIERLVRPLDPERAGKAVRALSLSADDASAGTSPELAQLHIERSLRALPRERVVARAERAASIYHRVALALAFGAAVLASLRGFAIFEGIDVLLATKHKAPLPIRWLDGVEVVARPPDYLHERQRLLWPYSAVALPRGSILSFHGVPLHPGRKLLLTDGVAEVPFVEDGAGEVAARWTLAATKDLWIVARFGDVTIREAEATPVESIADDPPVVTLEGAPETLRLAEIGGSATIPIKYTAIDDHGLRNVELVLRSGAREDRRVLAHLDGETESSRGGYTLRASDSFLKKSHAPVEIRVEAKDNDTVTGPKWGASAAIMVIPPEAGEPEAAVVDALRVLRDRLVDSLAERMGRSFTAPAPARAPLAKADKDSVDVDELTIENTAKGSYAGMGLKKRIVALLRGQMRRVKEAMLGETRSPGVASHGRLVAASERIVLVADAVVRGLAQRDARVVARELADVADDLELGTIEMSRAEERERGALRADGSVVVLEGGERSLLRLGSLGRDLGEIVGMDLARVARAREDDDLVHAEIAASNLATRLKDPSPSFGAQGSSGGRAGGESGGGRGTPSEGDPEDDEEDAFDKASGTLDKLSQDHEDELAKVEDLMRDPESGEPGKGSEEDKSHAAAVRDATRGLPSVGAGSDSWTNKGASARELAEAMARALEDGTAAEAVTNGQSALDALDEAKHIAQRERWTGLFSPADQDMDRTGADKRIEAAKKKLEPEVRWAEEKLAAMKKRAAEKNAADLASHGNEEERLAERAADLRSGGEGDKALPEAALEALHKAEQAAERAASSLRRGEGDKGLAGQREAQRKLEEARQAMGGDTSGDDKGKGDGRNGRDEGKDASSSGHADIPGADAHKGPEEFRRRVLDGLGKPGGARQRDAVRRYADGLLR